MSTPAANVPAAEPGNALAGEQTPPPGAPPAAAPPAAAPPATPPEGTPPPAAATPPEGTPPEGTPPATPPADDRNPAERRIQDLVAQNKAIKEYADFWRVRAGQGAAVPAPGEPAAQPAVVEPTPAPKLADFKGDTEKWSVEYAAWNEKEVDRRVDAKVETAGTAARATEARNTAVSAYQGRCQTFAGEKADFYEVVNNDGLSITDHMRDAIVVSDVGPDIAYHLGTNPMEAVAISRMPAAQQLMRMGELGATLKAAKGTPPTPPAGGTPPAAAPTPPNNPPPPGTPLGGSTPPSINLESCTLDEFLQHRLGTRPTN